MRQLLILFLCVFLSVGTVYGANYVDYPVTEIGGGVEVDGNWFTVESGSPQINGKPLYHDVWVDDFRIEHYNPDEGTALLVQKKFTSDLLSLSIAPHTWWTKYGETSGVDSVVEGTRLMLHTQVEWEASLTNVCSFADYEIFNTAGNSRVDYGKCTNLNQHSGRGEFSCKSLIYPEGEYYAFTVEYYADKTCGSAGITYRNQKSPASGNDFVTVTKATVVDSQAPSVSITSPTSGGSYETSSSFSLKATASDDVGIDEIRVYIDGAYHMNMYTGGAGYYSAYVSLRGLQEGGHTVIVKAYDSSNNIGSDAMSFQLTTTEYTDPNKDSDGDGTPDTGDSCPATYAKTSDGCPDADDCAVVGGCGDIDTKWCALKFTSIPESQWTSQLCEKPSECGNSKCEALDGETPDSCPADCGGAFAPFCGNGVCEYGEGKDICPADCEECGFGLCIDIPDIPCALQPGGCDNPECESRGKITCPDGACADTNEDCKGGDTGERTPWLFYIGIVVVIIGVVSIFGFQYAPGMYIALAGFLMAVVGYLFGI